MKWEHKIVAWTEDYRDRDLEAERQDIVNRLDGISADGGWDLVDFHGHGAVNGTHYWSLWKRPVQQ